MKGAAPATSPMTQAFGAASPISRRELKQLMRRSDMPGLAHLAGWLLVLLATGSLVALAGDDLRLLLPAMLLHGIVVVHHFALLHECSHFTPFRSAWICRVLAYWCGFLMVIPPLFFRYEHTDHHTWTNLHGRDPELIELPDSLGGYLLYLSSLPYWWYNVAGLVRRAFGVIREGEKRFIPETERWKIVLESRVFLTGYVLLGVTASALEWSAPLIFWILPMLLGEPVMRFIRMTEHVGRPNVGDMRLNTRTSIVSAPWRFLAWNMPYHAEHHFAAAVPFHALPALHDKLRDHVFVERQGYLRAHLDILGQITGRRQRLGSRAKDIRDDLSGRSSEQRD